MPAEQHTIQPWPQTSPKSSPAVILVVEDDRSTRTLLRLAMAEEGYQVVEAKDGEQGLTEYKNCQPDMVLLDAVMPGMDGFNCCRYLRELPGGEEIPIMSLTVLDDQASVDQAFDAGATDYITKPIHWPVLSQRVQRLLAANQAMIVARQARRSLYQQQAWMQLMRDTLTRFTTAAALWDILQLTVTEIQQIWGGALIALWQRATPQAVHAGSYDTLVPAAPPSAASAALHLELLDLAMNSPWQSQLLAGESVLLMPGHPDEVPQSSALPARCFEHLQSLALEVLIVVPILTAGKVWGYLYVGDDQPMEAEDQPMVQYVCDFAKMLGIIVDRDQCRQSIDAQAPPQAPVI